MISDTLRVITGLSGVQSVEDLKIEGVVIDRVRGSYVVVNGVVLAEGASEDGVKAVRIEEDGVLFSINGRQNFKQFKANDKRENGG